MLTVMNCYLSNGKTIIDGKNITWDNVVLECIGDNFINNADMVEQPVFGGKFEKVKIAKESFVKICKYDIKELQGRNIEIFYDRSRKPVELKIVK